MIESGIGTPSPAQIVNLAALAVILGTAYSLDKACSPRVKSSLQVKPKEQAELLDQFLKLNPEAQRGALQYIQRMREGYQKPRGGSNSG